MFVFHVPGRLPEAYFETEERYIVLKFYGQIYMRLQRFLWDYLEIAAEAQSTTIPDLLEHMLARQIEEKQTGQNFVAPIMVGLAMATVAVDRATYGFANDDGDGDAGPTLAWQLPSLDRYQKGIAVSARARAMVLATLRPLFGDARTAAALPDLHAKRFAQVKRLRARHRKAKPQLVSE